MKSPLLKNKPLPLQQTTPLLLSYCLVQQQQEVQRGRQRLGQSTDTPVVCIRHHM